MVMINIVLFECLKTLFFPHVCNIHMIFVLILKHYFDTLILILDLASIIQLDLIIEEKKLFTHFNAHLLYISITEILRLQLLILTTHFIIIRTEDVC